MTRAVFMVVFLVVACAAVEGPEEASMLQTPLQHKLRDVEKVVGKIASGVRSRKQKTESTNWEVCDQCDASNLDIDSENRFCWPGTAEYCDADPCDPTNPLVDHPGWWCRPGTSKVIVSSYEYKRADYYSVIHVNQPRSQQRKFGAMYAIPPARTWKCVPCDPNNAKVKGKWCEPKTADECSHPCDPCDPSNSDVNKKGWFCRRSTKDVCVDHNGMTVLNYAAAKFDANGTVIEGVMPGAAISTLTCNNDPWCVWGAVAGAIVVVIVTAGIAAAAVGGAAGGVATGSAVVAANASVTSEAYIAAASAYYAGGSISIGTSSSVAFATTSSSVGEALATIVGTGLIL